MSYVTKKFNFQNKEGQTLSGRLELPSSQPRAFAILAHCFTCSKDFIAATRIARKLGEQGIATLRFDFTGLGNSDGDFANTNFSSNVSDLVCAYHALAEEYQAPKILIGHSLGGAAVLKSSLQLPEVTAVVTISSPSDTRHVTHLFTSDIDTIQKDGEAVVNLAGRKFKIKKQFIDDVQEQSLLEGLSRCKKAFLIMHSATDDTVSIDHAGSIFLAVKHPKSFVTLDGANHLLTDAEDAEYAAKMISTWVSRYLPASLSERPQVESGVLVSNRQGHLFTHDIYSDKHQLIADEPPKVKGDDLGMDPYELLLSSLGACTAMTMKMYAQRKGISIDDIRVELKHSKNHKEDCDDCESGGKRLDHIEKNIHITGDMSPEQKQRILEIAERCPVNQTLLSEVIIKSTHS